MYAGDLACPRSVGAYSSGAPLRRRRIAHSALESQHTHSGSVIGVMAPARFREMKETVNSKQARNLSETRDFQSRVTVMYQAPARAWSRCGSRLIKSTDRKNRTSIWLGNSSREMRDSLIARGTSEAPVYIGLSFRAQSARGWAGSRIGLLVISLTLRFDGGSAPRKR
jgi:hypothetical protein